MKSSSMGDVILEMKDIRKSYPGVSALSGVTLCVRRGEIHGLMGENGAGKSTLIKVLAGATRPDSGTIHFDGHDYVGFSPSEAMALGIGVIYQEFNLIPFMSVAENVFLGNELVAGPLTRDAQMKKRTRALLDELGIDIDPNAQVRQLTIAYQQMVEIVKAVSRKVKLLVMDEPTAPLSNREVDQLKLLISRLRAQGITIVYISHRLEEIFELTNAVTVLRDGSYIGTLETARVTRRELIAMMVGRSLTETYPAGAHARAETVLEVRNLSGNRFSNISFALKRGEILGISGLVGAGRTEVARAVFGADLVSDGEILVDGRVINIKSPKEATKAGIALIPEDRKQQGLLLSMSVGNNVTLAALSRFGSFGFLNPSQEHRAARRQIERLAIKTPSVDQRVKLLSGGNQQKVVLGKWLETNARILIFDEPTRGIDVVAKQEIYRLMRELTAQGVSIIMISSEMPELIGISDRILVMSRGRIAGELAAAEFSQDRI
jgi:ribose transport system ATP-binding protein